MIPLPRLFVKGVFKRIVHPISVSITQNAVPLDTASLTLPIGEELPSRSYVELFTPYGSAGMFRVRSPHDAYGQETTTAELEHMISEVGDYVVKEEISEMLAASTAMKRVFKHYGGSYWKLGSVTALGNDKIACEAKYDGVLDAMLAILEQKKDCMMAFDFTTSPWTVKIVKKDTAVSAEGRLARNVSSATITYDDTELCTRVWYQVFDKNKKATWKSKDASTKSKYGIIEGKVSTSADMTDEEINATVNAYLEDHKAPRVSVNVQGVELCQITGEKLDKVTVGKLYRLALPDYGITVEENITSLTWSDVYNNPRSVSVNLGAEEDTVVTFLHNLDASGAGGGGGGKKKEKEEEKWSEYKTDWQVTNEYIAGMATKQDKHGNILEQAGLTLNSKGLLVYAKTANGLYHQFDVLSGSFTSKINNTREDLESQIKQESDRISLVVTGTGKKAKINAASIVLSINKAGESEAHISADKVYIGNSKSTTVIAGKCTLSDVTVDYIAGKIATMATLRGISANFSGNITAAGALTGSGVYIGSSAPYKNVADGVSSIRVEPDGNDYKLQYKTYTGSEWQDAGTFSRATSLSGDWSSGILTVTASPQNKKYKDSLQSGNASWANGLCTIPIQHSSDGGYHFYNTGFSAYASVNKSDISIPLAWSVAVTDPDADVKVNLNKNYPYHKCTINVHGQTKTLRVYLT